MIDHGEIFGKQPATNGKEFPRGMQLVGAFGSEAAKSRSGEIREIG
jgi:hypothetical protein